MINIDALLPFFPAQVHRNRPFILREYLQYKILEILFDGSFRHKFSFLGGTCLRIVHDNSRFSEDLDFDNFGLSATDFDACATEIRAGLQREGFEVEMRNVHAGAYYCYLKFPNLLFAQNLSGHREEKILICLDTEPQLFDFTPKVHFLQKFGIVSSILVTPPDLLLAQKMNAICNRKRAKGRDFFDVVFLLGNGIRPNYDYLEAKLSVNSPEKLREKILDHCAELNITNLALDVQPFLFHPNEDKKVRNFVPFFEQAKLV
jgi:predicted nucleotidyltransferase component of viral defense system